MDRIQTQASELWDLLFAKETANTYQSALSLTGNILKESAQLVWLVICSFFVFGAWFGDASMKTGKGVRNWVDKKDISVPDPETTKEIAAQKSKSLLDTGRESIAVALNKAREELGLDPNAPLAAPREDSPVAKLVAPAAEPAVEPAPSPTESSSVVSSDPAPSATEPPPTEPSASPSPSAGVATARPASSEGQNIGPSYASSRGSGAAASGFGGESSFADKTPGSQSGGPKSSKYDNQDYDDDPSDEDESEESSWPPQTTED